MLKKGDAVVHPGHGAGVLTGTQTRKVSGVKRNYHRIDLVSGRGTLFIPEDQVEESGLLPVPGNARSIVFSVFDAPQELSNDYRERKANIADKIHSGDIVLVAEALRDLAWRERETKLSDGDSRLKAEAQELLAGVLSLQLDVELHEATARINRTLDRALRAQPAYGNGR